MVWCSRCWRFIAKSCRPTLRSLQHSSWTRCLLVCLCPKAFSSLRSTLPTCARWKCWQNHTLVCPSTTEGWELMDQYCIGAQPCCVFCKSLQGSSSWDWFLVFPQWCVVDWHTFNWHSSLPCSNFPCPGCASWDYLPRNYLNLNSCLQVCFGGGGGSENPN